MKTKFIGWKITVFTENYTSLGVVKDYGLEYGNSPIRDKKSRMEKIKELCDSGVNFSVEPIVR